ncbi:MAG TPA: asparagine synthase (glutamine-hydrolyzing) [Vicinamibacterales bacterium]|nr:asparagine synthase (glutamine-hydrolyzing) [Vicinamibacterales bacterium]
MCGIAGILTTGEPPDQLRPALLAMQQALRHRGPDDEGTWQSASGTALFAHTRLSVVDLTPAGRQPMSTSDGTLTVVLNGEIYNLAELRAELGREGAAFRTRTDAEVVLHAYRVHGAACVELFRGMFALALWDERDQSCLLARDRFGIKPLYYAATGERLVFGSEVRALTASALVSRDLDSQALYEYFRSGSVPEPRTLLRDVRCLPAGCHARWHRGRLHARRYWSMSFADASAAAPPSIEQTRAALLDSVRRHLASDVPVGLLLSGGIDSTALLALAHANGERELRTFSMSLPGSPVDEGPMARRVAEHFGARHQDYPVDAATGRELFRGFVRAFDQPSIDGLNVFAMAGFARTHGIVVTLTGLGADELFGGYQSFDWVPWMARWDTRFNAVPAVRRLAGGVLERIARGPRWRRVGDMFGQPPGVTSAYTTFRGIFTRAEASALTRHYFAGAAECSTDEAVDPLVASTTAEDAVSGLELARYVRNQLLRDGDVMSLAWGLELRTPFLDSAVFDTARRIPAAVRLRRGKQLLLDAVPEVPAWVARRSKACFQLPFGEWLNGEWRDTFAEIDRQSPVATQTWYRSWTLFMFERWRERLAGALSRPDAAVPVGVRTDG